MRIREILVALTLGFSVSGSTALALVNGELFMGNPSMKLKARPDAEEANMSGSFMSVAVLVDPIPLVPVAFGLGMNMPTLSGDSNGEDIELKGASFDLLVKAWFPISIGGLTPYGKLGLTLFGGQTATTKIAVGGVSKSLELPYKNSGTNISFGVSYSVIPLVAAMFEISMVSQTMEVLDPEISSGDAATDAAVKAWKGDKGELKGTNLLLGVQVGI